jgi:hypothetical protein
MKEFYLAAQNKPSLNVSSRIFTFLFRLTPILLPAAAMVILGYNLLGLVPARWRIYLVIPFLFLFIAVSILDQESGWNVVLLLGFSLTAGALLNWSGAETAQWSTWLLFLGLLIAAMGWAISMGAELEQYLTLLIPLTFIYLIGWVGIIIWDIPGWIRSAWILIGLSLFTAIAAGVLQRGLNLEVEDNPVPLSIELWVILFNLFWLAGWIPIGR